MTFETHDQHDVERRLNHFGPRVLNDAELMSVVAGKPVRFSLTTLLAESVENLNEYHGLSPRGARRLLAAVELGRRALRLDPSALDGRARLNSPQAVREYAQRELTGLRREEMHVLCLNSKNDLLRHARVAEGSVDCCSVDPREVFAPAVVARASGVVLVHNHPTGDAEPSIADVTLTRRLVEGAAVLGLRLLDHVIIGHPTCVSLLERGLLHPGPTLNASLQSS